MSSEGITLAGALVEGTGDPRGRIFVDSSAYRDPTTWHRAAAELRRDCPVLPVQAEGFPPFWAVTKHADVTTISRHDKRFRNANDPILFSHAVTDGMLATGVNLKSLIHMDGDEHTRHRGLTNDWFKPASLATREAEIGQLAREFVDRLAGRDEILDVAADIAVPFPLHVIMTTLGIPTEDEALMLELTQNVFSPDDPDRSANKDDGDNALMMTLIKFASYFSQLTVERRAHPSDDLASVIANGLVDGEPLGDLETIGYYVTIATAGHDTTTFCLAGGLEALARNPTQLAELQRDPSLVANAVEEIIRWTSPVRHFLRHAAEDCEISGARISAGDTLLLSYPSANRDEDVFDQPDVFDVTRHNAREHLGFGFGRHHCLGSQLARIELRAFLGEFVQRLEHLELAGDPAWSEANFISGVKRLPVRCRLR